MTKTIDQWAAEQCGVEIAPPPLEGNVIIYVYWRLKGQGYIYPWTIKDPRCREIVRWKLRINTNELDEHDWIATKHYTKYDWIEGRGGCIAESEIACITAIYEAQK